MYFTILFVGFFKTPRSTGRVTGRYTGQVAHRVGNACNTCHENPGIESSTFVFTARYSTTKPHRLTQETCNSRIVIKSRNNVSSVNDEKMNYFII